MNEQMPRRNHVPGGGGGNGRPANGEYKRPAGGGNGRPANGEYKRPASSNNGRPAGSNSRPANGENRRPASGNARPAGGSPRSAGSRPANGAARPAQPGRRPQQAAGPAPRQRRVPGDDKTRIQAALGSDGGGNGGKPPVQGKIKPGVVIRVMLLNLLKAFVVVCCLGLMVGCVVGVQMVQWVVETTENDEAVLDLENLPLKQTSYFMALDPNKPNARETRAEDDYIVHQELIGDENRVWVSGDQIPDYLKQAVVAVEDEGFYDHHGVDFARTAFALANEFLNIRNQFGASTVDQQLVKNITGDDVVEVGGDRTEGYKRKIREIFRAWSLNNNYPKETIMEAYLNTIGLSERLAGVEAGAQAYFGKTVSELTLAECATIAGITRAPTYYSPFQNPENSRNRRNYVLEKMWENEFITLQQKNEAQALPLGLAPRRQTQSTQTTSDTIFSYASDKVFKDVIADYMAQENCTYSEAFQKLYNSGWKVYMTVDLRVQAALDDIMVTGYEEGGYFMDETRFPGYVRALTQYDEVKNAAGEVIDRVEVLPQAAVAVINYDGELIATNGYIGRKETSLSLNRAMGTVKYNEAGDPYVEGTVRQVGSTMKPIAAYALGLDYGIITYSKMIKDAAVASRNPYNPSRDAETGAVIKDWPRNYSPGYRNTPIPIVSAIAESTNTVAVQVGMYVQREPMFEFLTETLGITSLVDSSHQPNDVDYAPLVLGSMTYGMSVYELAGAYMMFGGNETYGQFNTLHSYTKVVDSKGNVVLEPEVMQMQAIDPETGYVMNRMLANVIRSGSYPGGASPTAAGMVPAHPDGEMDAVAKTGTTSDDKDRLFVGLTPYYVTAVWWGYDNPDDHDFYGRWSAGARTNIPVNVWKSLMETVQAELPIKEFPEKPEGVQEQRYCTSSGNLAISGCPSAPAYYTSFKIPEPCSGHAGEEGEPPPEG